MKKLILSVFLGMSSLSFGQLAPPKQKINLHLDMVSYGNKESNTKIGLPMMLGGVVFTAAGLLTPPIMVGGSTTEKQPFFKQGVRSVAIITGPIVFVTGVVFAIGEKD